MANKVNREYKSSLFSYMFSQKEYALQLYNALNNSNYDNPEDIQITTLENVVFINIYNDVSFMFNSTLQLYEHQSTYCPNIPLRNLFYLSNSYEKLLNRQKSNLYSSRLIKIPTPKCVVFYNGTKEFPDRMELKLSDSFYNQEVKGDLELTVLMLNINFNHNKELFEKCEILHAYSLYIAKFREYNETTELSLKEAAIKALDYCISINVMADFFTERRNEVVGMILEEYTKERVEQDMADMAQEIADMKQELSELKNEKDALINEKDAEIQSKDAEIQSKDAEIARLRKALEMAGSK